MERVLLVLSLLSLLVQKCLLYWYKSGGSFRGCGVFAAGTSIYLLSGTKVQILTQVERVLQVLSLLALLVKKYKY